MATNGENETAFNDVARISIKCPTFQKDNINIFFAQLEATFAINRISSELTKFNYLITSLEPDILAQCPEILLSVPDTDPYTTLKNKVIEIFQDSAAKKIRILLQELSLGDQKPSLLLSKMKQLAGNQVTEDFLRTFWISKLPQNMQAILSISSESLPKLSQIADKISEVNDAIPTQVGRISTDDSEIIALKEQIQTLTRKIEELTAQRRPTRQDGNSCRFRLPSRSRPKSYGHSQERHQSAKPNAFCFYHKRFGINARKCTHPCGFESNQKN